MFGRSKHGWIGLDIGASCIKLAQVVRHGDRLQVHDASIVPRQIPWSDDDMLSVAPISAADEVASALVTSPQVAGRHSAAVLSATTCQLNTAPFVKEGGSAQIAAIVDELATMGVSLAGRVFDYWPSLAGKADQSTVHLLSTSRDWSETTTADLRSAGLICEVIDGLPHALARAVTLLSPPSSSTVGALDWSYSGATFVLVDNGEPVYVRQLRQCAWHEVLKTVSEQLSLDEQEASELLRTIDLTPRGFGPKDEVAEAVAEIIEPQLAHLTSELQRTLEHLHNTGKQLTPQRLFLAPQLLYLFGGGATLGGGDQLLSHRLRRQVKSWTLPGESDTTRTGTPMCLLGPAIALSALRWEEHEQ